MISMADLNDRGSSMAQDHGDDDQGVPLEPVKVGRVHLRSGTTPHADEDGIRVER